METLVETERERRSALVEKSLQDQVQGRGKVLQLNN